MKIEALFCDVCGKHIPTIKEGIALFYFDDKVNSRKIKSALNNDSAICKDCIPAVIIQLTEWTQLRAEEKNHRTSPTPRSGGVAINNLKNKKMLSVDKNA